MSQPFSTTLKQFARRLGFDVIRYMPKDFEPSIVETIQQVRPYTMTSVERIHSLCKAVEYVSRNNLPGAMVECGVWKGGSMMAVAQTLLRLEDTRRDLYLFDTFSGMVEPGELDISKNGESAHHTWQKLSEDGEGWCESGLEEVKAAMALTGYPGQRMHYVAGKVEDTIPEGAPEQIALLRLDTDWYESTRHELVHLFPRLCVGGVLIIDDYGDWQGAKKAVDEYLADNNVPMLLNRIDPTGRIGIKLK